MGCLLKAFPSLTPVGSFCAAEYGGLFAEEPVNVLIRNMESCVFVC